MMRAVIVAWAAYVTTRLCPHGVALGPLDDHRRVLVWTPGGGSGKAPRPRGDERGFGRGVVLMARFQSIRQRFLVLAALVAASLSGCATVAGANHDQDVHIDSNPPGAQ